MHPYENTSYIFLFIFLGLIYYYAKKAYNDGKFIDVHNLDFVTIGYLEDQPIIQQIIEKKPSFESQQLYSDCIDALYSLGMKRSEAKKKAKFIFSTMSNPPTSIQEFLMIALKN